MLNLRQFSADASGTVSSKPAMVSSVKFGTLLPDPDDKDIDDDDMGGGEDACDEEGGIGCEGNDDSHIQDCKDKV